MMPAQAAAESSIVSAIRLVADRQGERVTWKSAETIVPPLAKAIHQTYSAIARPQATGMLTPQMPMPVTNRLVTATMRTRSSATAQPKPTHHQSGGRAL